MDDAARFERRAAILSLVVGVALLAVKFFAYFVTGSAAIFSDALESIVNVMASTMALYSIILAHSPADESHPYGHGKVEFLSAALEGGMILLAALVITARAMEQLVRGVQVQKVELGIVLSVAAMLVNAVVGLLLVRAGRRHGSIALEADGKHLLGDAVTTGGVVLALIVVAFTGWRWADPVGAMIVAGYISYLGWGLLRRATAGLMDEQDTEDDRLIRSILDTHLVPEGTKPLICSYHKLRHRHSGRHHWVDVHVVVPAHWSIEKGHGVATQLEQQIVQALGEASATTHVEPCVEPDCVGCGDETRAGRGEPAEGDLGRQETPLTQP
jgi:cation diffusion facilitator family transporter